MSNEVLRNIIVDSIDHPESILSSPDSQELNDLPLVNEQDVLFIQEGLSSDELISVSDIVKTEELIDQGKKEEIAEKRAEGFTVWSILAKCSINLLLPFINGMMLGFGEILAHEIGFRYNWFGAKVYPHRRMAARQQQQRQLKSNFL